jgi:hypothetical protein
MALYMKVETAKSVETVCLTYDGDSSSESSQRSWGALSVLAL